MATVRWPSLRILRSTMSLQIASSRKVVTAQKGVVPCFTTRHHLGARTLRLIVAILRFSLSLSRSPLLNSYPSLAVTSSFSDPSLHPRLLHSSVHLPTNFKSDIYLKFPDIKSGRVEKTEQEKPRDECLRRGCEVGRPGEDHPVQQVGVDAYVSTCARSLPQANQPTIRSSFCMND